MGITTSGDEEAGAHRLEPVLLRELKLPNPSQLVLAGVRQSGDFSLALYCSRELDVFG